jgi:hypothetical protein
MRIKSMRGLLSHNFDIDYVQALLEEGNLEREDALDILSNAINVIAGLRGDLSKLSWNVDQLKGISDSAKNSQWMKGQK